MSEHKKMYTSTPLLYTITFQPNKDHLSPDQVTFKGISHLKVSLSLSGESCQVKQRGGLGARKRRKENRHERLETKPIGKKERDEKKKGKEKEKKRNRKKRKKKRNCAELSAKRPVTST